MISGEVGHQDNRKGEVNELKAALRSRMIEKDPAKRRDVIKKVRSDLLCLQRIRHVLQVIAYMTIGIDVSKVFSEMVMVSCSILSVTLRFHVLFCKGCKHP